jgi:two-component system chemotaxis response regulator CheV
MQDNERFSVLLFRLAGAPDTLFAINLFKVLEITNPHHNVMPGMVNHTACIGLSETRGQVLPIVDISQAVFGRSDECKIWLRCEFSRRQVLIAISEVLHMEEALWTELEASSNLPWYAGSEYLTGVLKLQAGQIVSVLDMDRVIDDVLGDRENPEIELSASLAGKQVVFADDSRLAREQVKVLLQKLGAKIRECIDGEDAGNELARVKNECAEAGVPVASVMPLVVTDIEMPKKNGYMVVQQIRSDPAFSGVKVVMYSSLSATETSRHGKECGADEVVGKFSNAALAEAILKLMC